MSPAGKYSAKLLVFCCLLLVQVEIIQPCLAAPSASDSTEADALYKQAWGLFRKSSTYCEQALPLINKAIRLNPNIVAYYILKAEIIDTMEEDDAEGLAALNKAETIEPRNFFVLTMKARYLLKMKQTKEAIVFAEKALSVAPTANAKADLYLIQSKALLSQGDLKGAEKSLDPAIKLCPDIEGLSFERGKLRMELKDYKGALEDFDHLEKIIHKDRLFMRMQVGLRRAKLYELLNDRPKATALYLALAAEFPDQHDILEKGIQYFHSIGDTENALKLGRQIQGLDNDVKPF